MKQGSVAVLLVSTLLLAACGSSSSEPKWEATRKAPDIARDECNEQVEVTMRLRGYPRRPSPETPQFGYRTEMFAKCMRAKGYAPD